MIESNGPEIVSSPDAPPNPSGATSADIAALQMIQSGRKVFDSGEGHALVEAGWATVSEEGHLLLTKSGEALLG